MRKLTFIICRGAHSYDGAIRLRSAPSSTLHTTSLLGPLLTTDFTDAGKTTTLDILAGRKTVGDIQGSILFAGQKAKSAFLKRHTGAVALNAGFNSVSLLHAEILDACFASLRLWSALTALLLLTQAFV